MGKREGRRREKGRREGVGENRMGKREGKKWEKRGEGEEEEMLLPSLF